MALTARSLLRRPSDSCVQLVSPGLAFGCIFFAVAWTSIMEDALERLGDAEHRLGGSPEAKATAVRDLQRARSEIEMAVASARRKVEIEAIAARDQLRRETQVLRAQFDKERHELHDLLDSERERHDIELAEASRRHSLVMEKERAELERTFDVYRNQRMDLEDGVRQALVVLREISGRWLPSRLRTFAAADLRRLAAVERS